MSNRGLAGLPIGLDCAQCGEPITVDYIAHGDGDPAALVSDAMQNLVKAAGRQAVESSARQLCAVCATPVATVINMRGARGRAAMAAARVAGTLVIIGRPTKWGNPYTLGRDGTRPEVIARYRDYLRTRPDLLAALPELRGKVLACWCAPAACHGDVLVELLLEEMNAKR